MSARDVDDRPGARSGLRARPCVAEIDQARTLRAEIPDSIVGGERDAIRIEGFDVGASPREFLEPRQDAHPLDDEWHADDRHGRRALRRSAVGSLLNLEAVVAAAHDRGEDVAILCAGYKGAFALDDAYCAGRIVQLLDGERTDAAVAAEVIAAAYPSALDGLNARAYGPPGLEEDTRSAPARACSSGAALEACRASLPRSL